MKPPLVSVFFITYNHRHYVRQALESVLSQKTTFPFQIIIGDDCSTDGTREIVAEFAQQLPDKIILKNPSKNLGAGKNFSQVFQACVKSGTRYIAYLEGDDFWTDPYKLQKQVDFLESNNDYVMCFSKVQVLKERPTDVVYYRVPKSDTLKFKDVVFAHYIPTLTILFRNIIEVPNWITKVKSCDRALAILLTTKGFARYFDEDMGVYRVHEGGITNTKKQKEAVSDDAYRMFKNLLQHANVKQKCILLYVIIKNRTAEYLRTIGFMRK